MKINLKIVINEKYWKIWDVQRVILFSLRQQNHNRKFSWIEICERKVEKLLNNLKDKRSFTNHKKTAIKWIKIIEHSHNKMC